MYKYCNDRCSSQFYIFPAGTCDMLPNIFEKLACYSIGAMLKIWISYEIVWNRRMFYIATSFWYCSNLLKFICQPFQYIEHSRKEFGKRMILFHWVSTLYIQTKTHMLLKWNLYRTAKLRVISWNIHSFFLILIYTVSFKIRI